MDQIDIVVLRTTIQHNKIRIDQLEMVRNGMQVRIGYKNHIELINTALYHINQANNLLEQTLLEQKSIES